MQTHQINQFYFIFLFLFIFLFFNTVFQCFRLEKIRKLKSEIWNLESTPRADQINYGVSAQNTRRMNRICRHKIAVAGF